MDQMPCDCKNTMHCSSAFLFALFPLVHEIPITHSSNLTTLSPNGSPIIALIPAMQNGSYSTTYYDQRHISHAYLDPIRRLRNAQRQAYVSLQERIAGMRYLGMSAFVCTGRKYQTIIQSDMFCADSEVGAGRGGTV